MTFVWWQPKGEKAYTYIPIDMSVYILFIYPYVFISLLQWKKPFNYRFSFVAQNGYFISIYMMFVYNIFIHSVWTTNCEDCDYYHSLIAAIRYILILGVDFFLYCFDSLPSVEWVFANEGCVDYRKKGASLNILYTLNRKIAW